MKDNEYKCAVCGGIFEMELTEEEAEEQLKREFGNINKKFCDIVCDDCFQEMNKQYSVEQFKENVEDQKGLYVILNGENRIKDILKLINKDR